MLSQIAGVVLSLSTPAGLVQNSFGWSGDAIAPSGMEAGQEQYPEAFAGWAGTGLAAVPNCHAQGPSRPAPALARPAERIAPSPPLPAISGQYQLDGGYYVRESGPMPRNRIGLGLAPAGPERPDRS